MCESAGVITRIVSGGQTGVDRAALDAALRHGLPYGGWCPRGGWAEDLPSPPGLRDRYPFLRETATDDPAERTAANVRDSDATLVLTVGGATSPGTERTVTVAERLGRPCLRVDAQDADGVGQVLAWLSDLGCPVALNVAGPRESEAPSAYHLGSTFLDRLLSGTRATSLGAMAEPEHADYRFVLANERTFLAYVRTALALQVAGLGVLQFLTAGRGVLSEVFGMSLVLVGSYVGAVGYLRWRKNERAIRTGAEIEPSVLPSVLSAAVVVAPLVAGAVLILL